jgi:hypothetical protein
MMRFAAIFAHQAGVTVNFPLHDAFLVETGAEDEADTIDTMASCMDRASSLVLEGAKATVKWRAIHWPDRYASDRPEARIMWRDVMKHLKVVEAESAGLSSTMTKVVTNEEVGHHWRGPPLLINEEPTPHQ